MGLFDALEKKLSGVTPDDIWNNISEPDHLTMILEESVGRPQLIYKHSHLCSVCFMSRGNLEKAAEDILNVADMHFLNVVRNRPASDHIEKELEVRHESPQVIIIDNKQVAWHASHGSIETDVILEELEGIA
ncbi:bacillithiol system redox-active protein YtxJ [Fodinibius halophilus]|uniref:Bacillithiol system redox-active protein YtxJ n=1 Tax=Fodinibius halophilus TaxID=1736908 RepID=A0A6M1TDJ5_9BACT|nr:bacillithiol system redox-active protein YtxJ [Fodinibius halophilus]NGP88242.1 bacillithiol system redox-active protein YtxJ [Fodinibius halophilus]